MAAVVLLLLPFFTFSQQLFIEETNKSTEINNSASDGLLISYSNQNVIYFANQNPSSSKKGKIVIYSVSLMDGRVDSITVKAEKRTKHLLTERIFSFAVLENKLIIINHYHIYTYALEHNKWKLSQVKKNDKSFKKIFTLTKNELMLYVNYNFHPMDAKDRHLWAKYNLINDSITNVTKMPDNNINFSPLVNSWVSVYKGLIAYSNTTEYRVNFYDTNFRIVDSIVSDRLAFNSKYLKNLPPGHSKDEIMSVLKMDDTLLTRIQKIFLIDSTSLLVVKKLPKQFFSLEFDFWKKSNNKWSLSGSEIRTGFYEKGKAYNENNQPANGIGGNVNGIEVLNKHLYFIYYPFFKNVNTDSFDYNIDYNNLINEMTRANQLFYGIRKCKIQAN